MIKNKIELTIDSKVINFHLGLGFVGELLDEQNIGIEELMDKLNKNAFKMLPIIMESSYRYNCFRENKETSLDLIDFIDALDNEGVNSGVFSEFLNAFTKSLTKDVPEEKVKKSTGKKK